MPLDLPASIQEAITKLREGDIQGADDLLVHSLDLYRENLERAGFGPAPASAGRFELLLNFFQIVSARFGNPPDLEGIIAQLAQPD